ncbi:protein ABHD11 [Scaptodrosophila lebanonensis]|uniref:sn-1-specific diacylglycerol lipase ABHD11 n=1 Tax=Drosophila lebanonensis TaxID=7225 RepID=A0A6J2U282_DROLE|nr:protein ABHD11 [Scaptodrosophila lebanonensis]
MQLFVKSLRFLRNGKFLTRTLTTEQNYAQQVEAVPLSSELFEGPKTDANTAPLITMHGLFGSKQNWRGISKALTSKTDRRIYTVDARNHGDSPHTSSHSSAGMSADVSSFLSTNSLSKACLMGHSMGGRTMMHFALTYPQLTDRLIVVDISPISIPRSFYEMNRIFDAMLNIAVPSNLPMAEGRKLVKEQMKQATDSMETVDFIMLNLRKKPDTGEFVWACNVQTLHDSLPHFGNYESELQNLKPYNGPTTFICGTRSPFMSPDHWPQVLKYFPNAEIHWLDAGHLVHFEQPQKFIQIVADFLNKK